MPTLSLQSARHLALPPALRTRLLALLLGSLLALPLPPAAAQTIPSLSPDPLHDVRALITAGDLPAAETRLRALIAAAPGDPEPRFLLGYVLFRQQRATDSLSTFTAAAALRNPTAEELTTVASDYVLLKDFADAKRWLTLATSTEPTNAGAWYLLGRTDYNLDLAEEAKSAFLTCLRLQPANIRARYNLGLAEERLRHPDAALAAYRQAIALEAQLPATGRVSRDSQPFLDLGMLLLQQDKAPEAQDPLKTAVQLAPGNPLAHQQLALALEKLGLYKEAAAEMALCARLAPDSQAPPFFLGRLYHRLGMEAEAKQQFARAQTLAGTHSAADVPNLEHATP